MNAVSLAQCLPVQHVSGLTEQFDGHNILFRQTTRLHTHTHTHTVLHMVAVRKWREAPIFQLI